MMTIKPIPRKELIEGETYLLNPIRGQQREVKKLSGNIIFVYPSVGYRNMLKTRGLYYPAEVQSFSIINPDGFSIRPNGAGEFKTESEAWADFDLWLDKFKDQGYYLTSVGSRLALDQVKAYCKIRVMLWRLLRDFDRLVALNMIEHENKTVVSS